ncbi:MAG: hypothetical protein PHC66_01555 [Candidatus Nanoarchaeia archaeon]|nr:hypothetical protein [Candidatus Nanoarchaeia archaeon]MDD5239155.1 hypothetical protein [Candidatus Nanoarchaeia archaeon]
MYPDAESLLKKLYSNLVNTLKLNKKFKKDTVIASFLSINSNVRFRFLKNSAIQSMHIPETVIKDLSQRGLIRNTDVWSEYTLTARGIYEEEKILGLLSESKIIDRLDEEFFNEFGEKSEKELTEKEKIVILAMVAARSFSIESPMDLARSKLTTDAWKDIIDASFNMLKKLKLISKLELDDLYGKPGKSGSESPVSALLRRCNVLPKKIKGLFKTPGNQKYYVELDKDQKIFTEELSFIFKRVFDDYSLSLKEREELYKFCNEISKKDYLIFNTVSHKFSEPKYDDMIKEALFYI